MVRRLLSVTLRNSTLVITSARRGYNTESLISIRALIRWFLAAEEHGIRTGSLRHLDGLRQDAFVFFLFFFFKFNIA